MKRGMKILFVCMGNICRSPTAHGVFEQLVRETSYTDRIVIDSAGTHAYHVGEAPDTRSQQHAKQRGYRLDHLRARQITVDDFEIFDLILVMDWENLALTEQLAPAHHRRKIKRLTEFCRKHSSTVVPDPYYKGSEGFEEVLDIVEDACEGLLEFTKNRLSA